jgi:hypothetical protein
VAANGDRHDGLEGTVIGRVMMWSADAEECEAEEGPHLVLALTGPGARRWSGPAVHTRPC